MPKGIYPHKQNEAVHNWKGAAASKVAKHQWMNYHYGKPQKCDDCGKSGYIKRGYDWANISSNYLRIRSDWKRLCKKCHHAFDYNLHKKGDDHKMSKLTSKKVRVIRWALFYGCSRRYISKGFNISLSQLGRIARLESWSHLQSQT